MLACSHLTGFSAYICESFSLLFCIPNVFFWFYVKKNKSRVIYELWTHKDLCFFRSVFTVFRVQTGYEITFRDVKRMQ